MTANSIEGLAERGASAMHAAFLSYRAEFNAITCRARVRFEQRDWHGMQDDALERLELYKKIVDGVVAETQAVLGEAVEAGSGLGADESLLFALHRRLWRLRDRRDLLQLHHAPHLRHRRRRSRPRVRRFRFQRAARALAAAGVSHLPTCRTDRRSGCARCWPIMLLPRPTPISIAMWRWPRARSTRTCTRRTSTRSKRWRPSRRSSIATPGPISSGGFDRAGA